MKNPHKVDISSENVKNNERMNLTVANPGESRANMDHLLDSTLTET